MTAVNFSANGTRWRVTPITTDIASKAHVPSLPGPGLLFTSTEAVMRFLALEPDSVPTIDSLQHTPVGDLAALVDVAQPLAR